MTRAERLPLFCSRCDGTGKVEDLGLCGVTLTICSLPAGHDGDHEGPVGNGTFRWSRGFDGPISTREVGLPAADLKRKSRIERLADGWVACWGVFDADPETSLKWLREDALAPTAGGFWFSEGRRYDYGSRKAAAAVADYVRRSSELDHVRARRFWRRKRSKAA